MSRLYDSNSITVIREDKERVRKRPTTYIPSTGKEGAIHIPFEVVDNSIDEVTVKGSVGDTVTLIFDTKSKVITVIDNGSGIPQEKLMEVCTVINSSGKFDNGEDTAYQFSGGTNGVGLKLAVFLSEWCDVTSMRDGKMLTYHFVDGDFKSEETKKVKEHGTIVKFKLGQQWVDIKSVTKKDIIDRYEEKSYLFPDAKLELLIMDGDKKIASYSYCGKDIEDRVKKMKPDTEIIRASDTRKVTLLKDLRDNDLTKKKVIVDVAFALSERILDADDDEKPKAIISYGNTIKTYMGGAHVDGLKEGLVKYFKENVKLGQKDKDLQILPSDITAGLCGFVVSKVYNPEFRGQYKDRLGNQEAKFAVRDVVYDKLCELKPSIINQYVDFVKRVARGRAASKKTRRKDVSSAFSKDRIAKFNDIIYNIKTVEPELILVEGDSAAGNAFAARDPYNQAIYTVKKPKNVFDDSSESINNAKEDAQSTFNEIINICGIDAGKKCDPSKSRMKKILMLTDGDVDGDQIAITVICLLAKHCKPMVDAGMVGRIVPPAYSFPDAKNSKKRIYVRSQREFFEKIMKAFIKNFTIGRKDKVFSKNELYAFLRDNFYYADKLNKLAARCCCDAKLLEYIATKYHGDENSQKQSYWINVLKMYPDLKVVKEGKTVVIDGTIGPLPTDYVNLAFDHDFDRRVKKFKEYQLVNAYIDGYTINGENNNTVYDIMTKFNKYRPKDVERFKGLGELDPHDLKVLCMDKSNRTVAIFKFKDLEHDMNKISVIMSTKKEFAQARADILSNMTADDMDIDT